MRQARPNFFSIGSSKFLLFWTLGVKKLPLFALTIMSNHVFRCVYSFFSNDKLARLLLAQICHFECVLYRGITVWDRCVNLCQGVSSLLWLENFLCVCRACVIANNKSYTHTHIHTHTHTQHPHKHTLLRPYWASENNHWHFMFINAGVNVITYDQKMLPRL